jgi:uncharacterized protein YukE
MNLVKRLRAHLNDYSAAVEAADRIEALEAALREAERFVAYLANETDGVFAGSGTPTTCLVMIRAALASQGTSTREAVIEECAKVCEGLRHVDYPSETSEWSSGTFDCAQAIRELVRRAQIDDRS